ncbi:MAG: NUDIX domain-containing protein, partial [Albidovulum sp.]
TVTRDLRHPYAAYFSVEEYALRYRRFDGEMSAELERAAFISGDAAIVLPYDPIRDRVMVIEQFRVGPYARGDANPWLIEAIAGRVDGGESPEEAARREAVEEAGLTLEKLIAGPDYYPSPGAKAEYLYSFVGIADLPDAAAGTGGLEDEDEDIRSHVIPFAQLMALIASGEVNNAPLIILAYWLDGQRPALRGGPAI